MRWITAAAVLLAGCGTAPEAAKSPEPDYMQVAKQADVENERLKTLTSERDALAADIESRRELLIANYAEKERLKALAGAGLLDDREARLKKELAALQAVEEKMPAIHAQADADIQPFKAKLAKADAAVKQQSQVARDAARRRDLMAQ